MEIVFTALTLLLIMDPLGNIPAFLAVLKDVAPERQRPVLVREILLAYAVLLIFLLAGGYVLQLFGLRPESISIAGGIILFIIAIRMIFPTEGGIVGETPDGEPFLVPLAIPLIAGPSVMASVLLLKQSGGINTVQLLAAVTLACRKRGNTLFRTILLPNIESAGPCRDGAADGNVASYPFSADVP